jgi:hypothetical protein
MFTGRPKRVSINCQCLVRDISSWLFKKNIVTTRTMTNLIIWRKNVTIITEKTFTEIKSTPPKTVLLHTARNRLHTICTLRARRNARCKRGADKCNLSENVKWRGKVTPKSWLQILWISNWWFWPRTRDADRSQEILRKRAFDITSYLI